jgi:hypothetical protein
MQFSAGWQNKRFLHVGSLSKFEAIFGSGMRAFFAILGLLLCLIETRADELPVIKDSEAVHYVGKNVELRGLVVSVTTSPLGTTFINFGREYPNQMFAGFIEAGSKIAPDQWIAALQGKIIGITGKIELHQGKAEIEVTSADQIKGLRFSAGEVTKTELASDSGRERVGWCRPSRDHRRKRDSITESSTVEMAVLF